MTRKDILSDAWRRNTELFLEEKITKCERRAIETLINNYLVEERAFYRLNERFVSNITGDIIFSTRPSERLIRPTKGHIRAANKGTYTRVWTYAYTRIDIRVYAKYERIIRVCVVRIYLSCTVGANKVVCVLCQLIAVHANIAHNILHLEYTSLYSICTCTYCIVQYCSDI